MSAKEHTKSRTTLTEQLFKDGADENGSLFSTESTEPRVAASLGTVDSTRMLSPPWNPTHLTSTTESQEITAGLSDNHKDQHTFCSRSSAKASSSQSFKGSDPMLRTLNPPQTTVHHSSSFGSQSVVQDNADSSETLTFPQSAKKVWDNSIEKKRLSTSWAIKKLSPVIPNASMERPNKENTEITEASSQYEETASPSGPEISISSTVLPHTSRPTTTAQDRQQERTRKRRRFWQTLRTPGSRTACFPKRLCSCLSSKWSQSIEIPPQHPVYEIRTLDFEDGIIQSRISMDSVATKQLEQVLEDDEGFITLSGPKLITYQNKLQNMLKSAFGLSVGAAILETWRNEPPAQPLQLSESVDNVDIYRNRVLTLADIDMMQVKRTTRTDDRNDTLFRYFKSYQGLTPRMLIP